METIFEEILFELFKKYEFDNRTVAKFIISSKEALTAYFNIMKNAVSLEVDFMDDDVIIRFVSLSFIQLKFWNFHGDIRIGHPRLQYSQRVACRLTDSESTPESKLSMRLTRLETWIENICLGF